MPTLVYGGAPGLVAEWDRASRGKRVAILQKFLAANRDATGAEVERALGPAALLFFTRITAWLRLTYQVLPHDLSIVLNTIALFLQNQRFVTNFMEVGGIHTVIDLLCQKAIRPEDKQSALLILIHMSNSGRVYREMICDGAGVDLIVQSLLHEADPRSLELFGALFLSLGQGNPKRASLVHAGLVYALHEGDDPARLTAATTLRSLQMSKQYYSAAGAAANPGSPVPPLTAYGTTPSPALLLPQSTPTPASFGLGTGTKSVPVFPSITNPLANRVVTSAAGSRPRINVTELPRLKSGVAQSPGGLVAAGSQHSLDVSATTASASTAEDRAGAALLRGFFDLLGSDNIKLRFEGTELMVIASHNPQLVDRVVGLLLDAIDAEPAVSVEAAARPAPFVFGPSVADDDADDGAWSTSFAQRRQAASARILYRIMCEETAPATNNPGTGTGMGTGTAGGGGGGALQRLTVREDVAVALERRSAHLSLLRLLKVSDPRDIDTQRECALALQRVVRCGDRFAAMRQVIRSVLGELFDGFKVAREFDIDALVALRNCLAKNEDYV